MYSIGHLFMGGDVRINSSGRSLFASSSIEEMLIEGLNGQVDTAFLLGSDVRFAIIRDSTLHCEVRDGGNAASSQKTKSTAKRQNSLSFHNVSMNVLVPDMLAHFAELTFFNSSIRNVQRCQRPSVNYLRNDLILKFVNTTVEAVESYAFSNISAHILNLTSCVIGKMNRFAAAGALLDRIHIINTDVQTIEEQLLAEARIKSFEVIGGRVGHIFPQAFMGAHVDEMMIASSHINVLDKYAFMGSRIHSLRISKTNVNNVRHRPFEHSQVRTSMQP
ncbi:hypothetical protein Y032_0022g614 [Ancylostoma ceylanicum]|uniref:Uncharacterized protein n=1 Tax=Ancylostoma ceylanicum TaxID=53326 RepID=A0A016UZ12_9BILA|nr:hypothetical protein Y032_0022g614 [Ancylostoma ceylanicum]